MAHPGRKSPLAAAVAAALASPALSAAVVAPAGSAIPVATTPSPTAERRPAIALDDNGNFVVVWDDNMSGTGIDVFARVFNADGSPRTGAIPVNTITAGAQQNPSVAMDGNGDFVVAWEGEYYASGPTDVYYRRFDSTGSPASPNDTNITFTIGTSETNVDTDLADDGRLAIAWEDPANNTVRAQVFDATDADTTGGAVQVPQGTLFSYADPAIAFGQASEFVVAFAAFDTNFSANTVQFQRFDGTGVPFSATADQDAATPSADNELRPAIASDVNGNFVIAWGNWTQDKVRVRRFAADGAAITAALDVVPSGTGGFIEPGVASDDDGDFAVSWSIGYYDASPGAYVRTYAPDGTADGPSQPAAQDSANNYESGSVGLDADGDAVVAWEEYGGAEGTAGADIFAQQFGRPPIAAAGPDQAVNGGDTVNLDGSGSTDPVGPVASYSWTQTGGGSVTLSGASTATPTFTAPAAGGTLSFDLTVTDDQGLTDTDTVAIVVNALPAANAGADQNVLASATVNLDGTASSDPDGTIQSYAWTQTGGTSVSLSGANTATPSFTAPSSSGTLTFQLTVTDDQGAMATDSVAVAVNAPPSANAGPGQTVSPASNVSLDGTRSSDPDGTIQSYAWTQTGGTSVSLSGANTATPSFTAPSSSGTLTFQLTVTDDQGATASDSVSVTVTAAAQKPVEGTGTGSTGWLGLLGLGLAGVGRRFGRRRGRGGLAGLLAGALALGAMVAPPPAEAARPGPQQQRAGSVQDAKGEVTAQRPGVSARSLTSGDPVFVGDHVRTGDDAIAVLRLADGTRVSLRPGSDFRVSRMQREQTDSGESTLGGMFMDLLRGGLRMITGSVADRNPDQYRLRTPVATIGVRGTEFDARLCNRGECPDDKGAAAADGPEAVAHALRLDGVVEAQGGGGATRVLDAGDAVFKGDTVRTAEGAWAVLQFTDRSKVSLQPATAFRVSEWEFERDEPESGNALLNLLRGGMRVLTGLIGDESPDSYKVGTPVATFGIRGTGFDLVCSGSCVNPDVTSLGAAEGDGLFVNTWKGQIYAQLDGRVAEFAAGQSGFLANGTAPPVRLPSRPPALQNLVAPRPDTVSGSLPKGSDRLYTHVRKGAIGVQGARGDVFTVGAGESAVVLSGGTPASLPETPDFIGAGDTGVPTPDLLGALGSLALGQFDLGTVYAGGTAGTGLAGSDSELENRIQRDYPSASVNDLSGGAAGRAFVGFRLLGVLGFEVGAVDLGDTESKIDPGTADPAAVAQDALDKHPITPRGLDLSVITRTPTDVSGTTWAFARAGFFRWKGEVRTKTPSGQTFSKEFSGTDPLVGGGVEYRIAPNAYARAEWIHYRLDPDPVNYVGAGVVWTLP